MTKTKVPTTVTNAVSWRSEGIKYKKNEVFIDVIESINVLVSWDRMWFIELWLSHERRPYVNVKAKRILLPAIRPHALQKYYPNLLEIQIIFNYLVIRQYLSNDSVWRIK